MGCLESVFELFNLFFLDSDAGIIPFCPVHGKRSKVFIWGASLSQVAPIDCIVKELRSQIKKNPAFGVYYFAVRRPFRRV